MSTSTAASTDLSVLEHRPQPGKPRPYHFPPFRRQRLENGLTLLTADVPGRPLLAANLLLAGGSADEPSGLAGITALMAHGLPEGTQRRSAVELVEASERLGAELHAEAGWEAVAASVEVPRRHFEPALGLLAEMVVLPSFPGAEIERLRDERLNDLLQARAEPRRRVEWAFAETIYAPNSPYHRPAGGTEATVADLSRDEVEKRHGAMADPRGATLIVAGELRDLPVETIAAAHFGEWRGRGRARAPALAEAQAHPTGARVVLVDRPGSAQTEIRVGHVGLPRRIPDYHAVSVVSAILGGLFNSRLQRLLREERGYTYGVGAGFEFRRSAGPFSVRTAVETEVTAAALTDIMAELRGIRARPASEDELREARDFLIGVFPLRFESPGQVAAALAGLVIHGLPDDELDRYRPGVAAVTADDVAEAARHIRPDEASIVLVGDAARVQAELEATDFGPVEVVKEPAVAPGEAAA
jgi:zinc protease